MEKNVLGTKIRNLRKSKGLSQDRLADKAGMTQQHVSRIENGYYLPGMLTISRIAKVLNVPIDDLSDIDIQNCEDKYTLGIMKKLDFLDIEDKSKVEGYIDRILDENGIEKIIIK